MFFTIRMYVKFFIFYRMSVSPLYILSADLPIGRFNKETLSQQTLMELLIQDFTNGQHIYGSKEDPKDIFEWMRVFFNESKDIVSIDWSFVFLEGSIDLQWLPPTIREVTLLWNRLTDTVDLTFFPDGLEVLNLGNNRFEGTIDLNKLPSGMQKLNLCGNKFIGSTDFSQLPKSLRYLSLEYTQLEGEVSQLDGELLNRYSGVRDVRKT